MSQKYSIIHNIGRMVNRYIITKFEGKMLMTTPVDPIHFPTLIEWVKLYFQIQHLSIDRYPLLQET